MSVIINGKEVGDEGQCYITFEAGPTHDGFETAKKLIDLAKEHGADAVKFQILDPERLVADKSQMFGFEILIDKKTGETKKVERPLYDLLKSRSLKKSEWIELKKHADSLNLAFFATVGFEDEVDLLQDIGCQSIKIASADLNHYPLLRLAAQTDMVIQIDTGNASLGEVEKAMDVISQAGGRDVIIHQCPSGYPAHLESINLNMIPTLKSLFNCPVAFSDHTPGWDMDIAAIALGANLVEKTITLDRCTPSVEHIMSLEPDQMSNFVKSIRDLEVALGDNRRILSSEQVLSRRAIRRSFYLQEDVKEGTPLALCKWEYRRPGFGIGPEYHDLLMKSKLSKNLSKGSPIKWSDFI
jgi:sialic acid synthase SpsE